MRRAHLTPRKEKRHWTIWASIDNWCSRLFPLRNICITRIRMCATAASARTIVRWRHFAARTRGSSRPAKCPWLIPKRCVAEMAEGVRLGCGAFWIPGMPVGDKSPGHPDFDPVWQAFCDLNVPFLLHVGPNSPTKIAAYENNGQPRPKDITGAEGGENLRVRDFMLLSVGPQQFLTALGFRRGICAISPVARRCDRTRRRLGARILAHPRPQPKNLQENRPFCGGAGAAGI